MIDNLPIIRLLLEIFYYSFTATRLAAGLTFRCSAVSKNNIIKKERTYNFLLFNVRWKAPGQNGTVL